MSSEFQGSGDVGVTGMAVASKQEKRGIGVGLYLWALAGCSGAALLTPHIFNLLCHLLSHSVPLVSWQPPRPVQRGNPQYKRRDVGEEKAH